MQYFNPEISKLQSLNRVFSTVYVLIFRTIIGAKNADFFCFCGLLHIPTFQIISWLLHNTIRLDIPRYKIFTDAFFFYVFFPALIFCLFLLKCSDIHLCSLPIIIFRNIKMMYWKRQNCWSCIFVKS